MTSNEPLAGRRAMALLEAAARHSATDRGVTRFFLDEHHAAVLPLIRGWMEDAGLEVRLDDAGTLIGRAEGSDPSAPVLITGSHQDSVREGGMFDGMMGVVLPIVALAELRRRGVILPCPVEVVAFGDEEGARFPTTLVGSRALAGTFDPAALAVRDPDGVSLAEALRKFGLDPDGIVRLARDPARVLAWVETHIEQGPVLEATGLPVGVVTAMSGIERHEVLIEGKAGHAGTVPMTMRHDALAAGAEIVLLLERLCRESDDMLVGVVGRIGIEPGTVNVIPGACSLIVELRSPADERRREARARLLDGIAAIAAARGVRIDAKLTYEAGAVACAPWLQDALGRAVREIGIEERRLHSGAGHDGLAMNDLCPIGMLFVRCREGLSHHPDEHVEVADLDAAVRVLMRFFETLGETLRPA